MIQPGLGFTLSQLQAVAAWSAQRPLGLSACVVLDLDVAEEVAEVTGADPTLPRWFLTPMIDGGVALGQSNGSGREWVLETVEKALALLEEEEEALVRAG